MKKFLPSLGWLTKKEYFGIDYAKMEESVALNDFLDQSKDDIYTSQAKKIFNTEEPNKLQRSAVKLAFLHIGYGPQEPNEIALEQVAKANYRNLLAGDV